MLQIMYWKVYVCTSYSYLAVRNVSSGCDMSTSLAVTPTICLPHRIGVEHIKIDVLRVADHNSMTMLQLD